jgi:hypothetical protein
VAAVAVLSAVLALMANPGADPDADRFSEGRHQ